MSELPKGWQTTKLGEVVTLKTGPFGSALHKTDYRNGGIPLINPTHIRCGSLVPAADVAVSIETAIRLLEYRLNDGDIVMGRRGEMGRCAVVPPHAQGWICGTGSVVIKSTAAIAPQYLQRFLTAPETVATLIGDSVGSTMVNLNQSVLFGLDIPIAPFPEQKRIADKLDTVLARVDACRDRLDRIPALLKRFRQSILVAATSGRLTEDWRTVCSPDEALQSPGSAVPDSSNEAPTPRLAAVRSPIVIFPSDQDPLVNGWAWQSLTSLAQLESGHTPRKSVPEYWDRGTVPWISLQDIRAADGTVIYDTKYKPTELGIANSSARLLPAGTVCFCRDISFGYVTIMGKEMSTTQHFANWVCSRQLVPKYLMYSFMAGRDFLGMSGQGTTVTTIYMPTLKELRLATPPLAEQREIVRRVEILFVFADRLEARLATARKQVGQLTPALLAKAFRGELVPQDPNDEPAAELLKRFAAQREAAPKAKHGRKTTVA